MAYNGRDRQGTDAIRKEPTMFTSYASVTPSLSAHEATVKERVHAARYQDRSEAERVIDGYTNIRRTDPFVYEHAVGCVQEYARDYQQGIGFTYVWDGFTIAEQLAQLAVESMNEIVVEAMMS